MDEEMEVILVPDDEEDEEEKLLADNDNMSDRSIEQVDLDSDSDSAQAMKSPSDCSEDEEESEAKAAAQVKSIRDTLVRNPYHYEAHQQLIEQLGKMGELEQLRAAREDMSSKYPLPQDMWLSWMKDEIKLASTPEQKSTVMDLCERAMQDYLSVELWLEYLQFCTGLGTEKDTTEKIRSVFERALTAAGLHVSKGSLIWDTYREFENFMVSMMDQSDEVQKLDQINRIGKLYRRQLACPLTNMEDTFEEYELWRQSEGSGCIEDPKMISNAFKMALKQLQERQLFEKKLEDPEDKTEKLSMYKTYLTYEKRNGDPGRVTVLYERALADLSLEPELWLDYLDYVSSTLKMDDLTQKIFDRAVRNVPYSVKIWQKYLRFGEKSKKSLTEMQSIVEQALESGFSACEDYKNLWITYLEFLRRRYDYLNDQEKSEDAKKILELLQNAFSKAWDHLVTFGMLVDPNCDLLQFWARTEAIHAKDMEKARSIWADIMDQGYSESASSWLELIALEKCYGTSKHIRKTFQKALNATKDYPESIASAWINFERDEGNLEQMENCEEKVKHRMEKVIEERQKLQYSSNQEDPRRQPKSQKRRYDGGSGNDGKWNNLAPPASKSAKYEKRTVTFVKPAEKPSKNSSKPTVPPPPGFTKETKSDKIAPPPGFEEDQESVDKKPETEEKFQEVDDTITVFVSNLDYSASEEEVREALKPAGEITMFRMVKDFRGRNKGFCYVQLTSPADVEEALKLDRTPINGRPMFVSKCDPQRTNKPGFKYKTGLEKNKLFVKGLPPSMTKEELEELFKAYGCLKEVRLVTFRNGHSKGLAYIDFENETDASKALLATDGMTIQDKVISVAISQPPERKKPAGDAIELKSLGGSSTSRTHFGKPKSVLSMIPRTVKTGAKPGGESLTNSEPKPMNNADFRNMLLSKK